jgi:hypothetical protein
MRVSPAFATASSKPNPHLIEGSIELMAAHRSHSIEDVTSLFVKVEAVYCSYSASSASDSYWRR